MLLFTGHSEHSIDAKGRLAVPAKYRGRLDEQRDGKGWYSVPYPGGVIRLYTQARFEALSDITPQKLTPDQDEAELEAELFGSAELLEMDVEGRVVLPKMHLDSAGLTSREVVIVGARNRLEIRDRAAWLAGRGERFARLPELVARIEAKRNAGRGTTA
ncbi:MAG: division/cell wall cluster transcriptional repressor MraZ [Phycisphaerales bacterium]